MTKQQTVSSLSFYTGKDCHITEKTSAHLNVFQRAAQLKILIGENQCTNINLAVELRRQFLVYLKTIEL